MESMNLFGKNNEKCADGLVHYQGELGDFWYDPNEFSIGQIGSDMLHYEGNGNSVSLPKGCINTRHMFEVCVCVLPEGFQLIDFNTSDVINMSHMFYGCKLSKGFSLGDKFDTSNVTDMAGMFAKAKLPEGFILGDKFTFGTAINLSNMFYCVEFPKGFSLNDFTFTANRDYADMFSGCKFPAGFQIGGFPIKQLGKIICSFTSKIVL